MHAFASLALAALAVPAANPDRSQPTMNVEKTVMGTLPAGEEIHAYTLSAGRLRAKIMTYGATLIALEAPDRQGRLENVTLALDSLGGYLAGHPFFGSIAGRYANRIGKGRFELDGKSYQLWTNGPNHLHGGKEGFDKKRWRAEPLRGEHFVGVRLTLVSPDGDQGYPGTVSAAVEYTLSDNDELKMVYTATTDKPTPINLTNHAYWNLGGIDGGDILGHELTLDADRYLPVDDTLLPLGELRAVKGTPMDFTRPAKIGARIAEVKGGYDHCYVLNKRAGETLSFAARAYDPSSGRTMEVYTDQPGVQLYTGNFLDGKLSSAGVVYRRHYGFCLETQHFPDSPNHPEYPSTILRPGQTYRQTTVHRFGVK